MCGISGLWSSTGPAPDAVARRMIHALHHRGPDSNAVWVAPDGALALGHARLAIVDLSDAGRQPMVSRSGRYVVVYNGEIYNHVELRDELARPVAWRGHSDTETLLEAMEQWGVERALQKCVGMFAIALWDRESRVLLLARDRMGEKPLYYGRGAQGFAFASELKALRLAPGLDFTLDEDALRDYVRVGYVAAPRSAYRGIRKLAPGTLLRIVDPAGALPEPVPYWTLPRPTAAQAQPGGDDERLDTLQRLLERSVRQQLLSDVPLGAFLSGGIDSSLVVATMQRCASQPVRTFSMGVGDVALDEAQHARRVAQHLGTEHTEMMVSPQDVLDVVPGLSGIYDEPFADASQVPTVLLSRLTRRHVTVALSGDAGDELFGGYNRYLTAMHLGPALARWPGGLRRAIGRGLSSVPARVWDRLGDAARAGGLRAVPPAMGEKVSRVAGFLSARDGAHAYLTTVSQWLDDASLPFDVPAAPAPLPPCDDAVLPQRMMWWDMQTYLPDDILVKVDRAAMASSLETRVPFLDHRIVEFALATPLHYKIRNGRTKWLLRELLGRHLPREMFERPKQGFTVPLDQWLRGPLRDWAEGLLSPVALQASGLVVPEKVRRTWHEHLSGRRNHQRALWTLLMLQAWLRDQRTMGVPRAADARVPAAVEPAAS